ncbi:DUF4258 domain-containing protein [Acuticoccus sp.]|uniref:DUF4258 domain-containing protein n=1 Tax=Acuticoccus sp. TaxID=1904378 RepID=UPI003B51D346
MRYTFTKHAQEEIEGRTLPLRWLEAAVERPIHVEPDPNDPTVDRRYAVIEEYGNRILRVVCRQKPHEVQIITVFFDRNAKRRL